MIDDLVIGMAGSGGDGVVSCGESLITAAARDGYCAIMTKSFGSQIRGGESSCRVRLSPRSIYNPGGTLDVAVAFELDDFIKLVSELSVGEGTLFIYESSSAGAAEKLLLLGVSRETAMAVPIARMAKQAAGDDRAKNSVVLGLLSGWLGISRDALLSVLAKKLAKKGPEVVSNNESAFRAGLTYAVEHPLEHPVTLAPAKARTARLLTDGNDMCAAAAIFAGCQFFAGYPITPSSEIMQFLGSHIWKYGGSLLQAEDEIAGVGAALGASFAGKKALTATSGPGMSLKSEIMGLATIAELPLVVVNVQRGGPSTGMPTKSEQADLFQAIFSSHGDVLRPVLAPTSVADTFPITVEAFNIAERFQTPVVILSDQEIAQRKETVDPIDVSRLTIEDRRAPSSEDLAEYKRFQLTDSGVSPVSYPGMLGGSYLGSGIEHDERGAPTGSGATHAKMNEKRFRKLAPLTSRSDLFHVAGDPKARLALVSWGSTAGVCREAFEMARADGLSVKLLIPYLLYPVAEDIYREFFRGVRAGLVVEQSHQGQLYRVLRMFVDLPEGVESMARSGAQPYQAREVARALRGLGSVLRAFSVERNEMPISEQGWVQS